MISANAASAKPIYNCDRLNINIREPPAAIIRNGSATRAVVVGVRVFPARARID
jgi:hypothetical protein